ncbi:MAG: tetratricopeptide repeat protein [Devosiaceae bacterium]|nr:tetratricopeptide repeat protein [Devosiaceae bacterium]
MSEENIFSEVDEELRNERMRNMWRKYAPLFIGLALAVVLAVAAKEGWEFYQKSVSSKSSEQYFAAIDFVEQDNVVAAQEALNIVINEGSGKYPILAQFRQAALLLSEGKNQQAVTAYDALATSLSEKRLRDLALLFAANALVDSGDVAAVNARIGGFIASDNSLRIMAEEILGLTYYANGDLDKARETFARVLLNPQAQSASLARIDIYISQLVAQGAKAPSVGENNN